jgi:hypothetical protein
MAAPAAVCCQIQPVRRKPHDAEPPHKPAHHHARMPGHRRSQWHLAEARGEHRLGRCVLKMTRGAATARQHALGGATTL